MQCELGLSDFLLGLTAHEAKRSTDWRVLLQGVVMHLLLERLSRGVHVLAEVHAVLFSWKDGSSTQSLSTEVRASVFLHTDLCCNLFTSSCADRGASGSTEVPNGSSVAAAVNAWLD